MSPCVERLKFLRGEYLHKPIPYFIVDLARPEEFIAALFDANAMEITRSVYGCAMKYIVEGDKMYVFPEKVAHSEFQLGLQSNRLDESLQSAGKISVNFSGAKPEREIFGYASTLIISLSVEKSTEYKNTVLQEKLGRFFKITNRI